MAIQELEIKIFHRSGRHNGNAGALSRFPVDGAKETANAPYGIVAAVTTTDEETDTLPELQRKDDHLATVIEFLTSGSLPADEKLAKSLVLSKS